MIIIELSDEFCIFCKDRVNDRDLDGNALTDIVIASFTIDLAYWLVNSEPSIVIVLQQPVESRMNVSSNGDEIPCKDVDTQYTS